MTVSDRNPLENPCNKTLQHTSVYSTTTQVNSDGSFDRIVTLPMDKEIRGCFHCAQHPSNSRRESSADGYDKNVALLGNTIAQADPKVLPHTSSALAGDVVVRNVAGGDVGPCTSAHSQPMLTAPLSWQANEGRNLQPTTSGRDLAVPLSPAVIPDPSPPSPKSRTKRHRPLKTLRKLFSGSKNAGNAKNAGKTKNGRCDSTAPTSAPVIESSMPTDSDTRPAQHRTFISGNRVGGLTVARSLSTDNVRDKQNDVFLDDFTVVDVTNLDRTADPHHEQVIDLTNRAQHDADNIDLGFSDNQDDKVIDLERTFDPEVPDSIPTWTENRPVAGSPLTSYSAVQTTWPTPDEVGESTKTDAATQVDLIDDFSNNLNAEIERLSRQIDELTSESACLKREQKFEQQAISQLKSTVGDLTDLGDELRRQLDRSRQGADELIDEMELLRQELSRLQVEVQFKTASLDRTSVEITRLERENADCKRESAALLESNADHSRTLTLLQTENESLQKYSSDAELLLEKMREDIATARSERAGYKALFVEAKLKASEELGHYIDELNVSLEEKRVIFHNAQQTVPFGSFGLRRALARTEEFLLLKSERNCLVDQVEFLSAKALAQDMYIEELESTLDEAVKSLNDSGKMEEIPEQFCRWVSTRNAETKYSRFRRIHFEDSESYKTASSNNVKHQTMSTTDSSPSHTPSASSSATTSHRDRHDVARASRTGNTATARRGDRENRPSGDERNVDVISSGTDVDTASLDYESSVSTRRGSRRRDDQVGGRNVSGHPRRSTSSTASYSGSSVDDEYAKHRGKSYDGIGYYDDEDSER